MTDRETRDAARFAFAHHTRCSYGPLGNRSTCVCAFCQGWQLRQAQRVAARQPVRRVTRKGTA